MTISHELKTQIEVQGFAKTGDIGGQPTITYWTPDGRQIKALPDMHEYVKKNGTKVETGVRDANLDKGWLLVRPDTLKPYCPHCDNWHDTLEEIETCKAKKERFFEKHSTGARSELAQNSQDWYIEMSEVKKEIAGLKELLEKISNAQHIT